MYEVFLYTFLIKYSTLVHILSTKFLLLIYSFSFRIERGPSVKKEASKVRVSLLLKYYTYY